MLSTLPSRFRSINENSNFAGGHIKVFIENQKEPLAEYRDKSPLSIQYFGFASYDNAPNKYFYNCEGGRVSSALFFLRESIGPFGFFFQVKTRTAKTI